MLMNDRRDSLYRHSKYFLVKEREPGKIATLTPGQFEDFSDHRIHLISEPFERRRKALGNLFMGYDRDPARRPSGPSYRKTEEKPKKDGSKLIVVDGAFGSAKSNAIASLQIAPAIITSQSKFWKPNVFTATRECERTADFEPRDFELYQEAVRGLPSGFGKSLKYIMARVPISIEQLAETTKTSARQLSRYLNDPNQQPKLKTVMALCMGLRLFPRFSLHLVEQAGFILRDNNEGLAYQLLIHEFYADGIEACNYYLGQMGLEPFFTPKKE